MKINRRYIFILFYVSIIVLLMFTYFYIQPHYGRHESRKRSESTTIIKN